MYHKVKGSHIRNKKRTEWQTWNFTNMINCFFCYVIKSVGQIAKKVLLSIIWNLLLIEINLSQIRISDSKGDKVCAVCPYLLFYYIITAYIARHLLQVLISESWTTVHVLHFIHILHFKKFYWNEGKCRKILQVQNKSDV